MWWMMMACDGKSDSADASEADADVDSDTDSDADSDTDAGDKPVVLEADSWCYHHDTGTPQTIWVATCAADDPQGAFTLDWQGRVEVWNGGSMTAEYTLACDVSGTGACSASWNEVDDGVLCATADAYDIRFVVFDEDGNESNPFSVTGRVDESAG